MKNVGMISAPKFVTVNWIGSMVRAIVEGTRADSLYVRYNGVRAWVTPGPAGTYQRA